jgi:hypothetical protein
VRRIFRDIALSTREIAPDNITPSSSSSAVSARIRLRICYVKVFDIPVLLAFFTVLRRFLELSLMWLGLLCLALIGGWVVWAIQEGRAPPDNGT